MGCLLAYRLLKKLIKPKGPLTDRNIEVFMKRLLLLVLFTLVSCDAPVRSRYIESGDYPSFSDGGGDGAGSGNGEGGDSFSGDDSGQNGSGQDSASNEPGFENCNLGHRYSAGSVGAFGICQSNQDERRFKASMAQSDSSQGTCFIPVHIQGDKSFNVGRAECVRNQANKTYYMTLYKSRGETVNGVMVMKANSVNAFMQCMSAKANFINMYPNCMYNTACMAAAEQEAQFYCSLFVQNHRNNYRQIQF